MSKKCKSCGEVKPIEEFYSHVRGYRESYCKVCNNKRSKKYREANKQKIAELGRKYYAANKERITEKAKKYREANKQKIAESRKKKYESYKVKHIGYIREYYKANKEKFIKRTKKYRKANRNKIRIDLSFRSNLGIAVKCAGDKEKLILIAKKLLRSGRSFKWQQRVWKLAEKDIDHALEAVIKNKITQKENLL